MRVLLIAILLAGGSGTAGSAVETGAVRVGEEPDVILHGSLTGADNQTWRLVPFDVPSGTTRITVDFDYTTRDLRTVIDIGMLE